MGGRKLHQAAIVGQADELLGIRASERHGFLNKNGEIVFDERTQELEADRFRELYHLNAEEILADGA